MKPIISVEGLGKSYTIRHEGQTHYRSLREEIFKLPGRLLKKSAARREEFWALRDVNFDIMPGERVGIIGRNGAGKSTLLKLLSRITVPTTGRITLRGRVASLLEVGTGFHPELTGRENIFLNGAILGMSRAEVRRKFDEIVDFAGVEKFLDTPVKRYSSGMYVRLAFAVAAHLEPEILIVDEVLAVGDAEFQKKCLGKMEEVGKEGRTVLFVSHNMAMVQQLCEKGIVLSGGQMEHFGKIEETVDKYINEIQSQIGFQRVGDQYAALNDIKLVDNKFNEKSNISVVEGFGIWIDYSVLKLGWQPDITFSLCDEKNVVIFHAVCKAECYDIGNYVYIAWIPKNFLNNIRYFINVGITTSNPVIIHAQSMISFDVADSFESASRKNDYRGKIHGVIRPCIEWQRVQ